MSTNRFVWDTGQYHNQDRNTELSPTKKQPKSISLGVTCKAVVVVDLGAKSMLIRKSDT
ncbi:MAG: hypothetical protein ISS77_08385 [Phycisphaerae bacterium]|nr:hypothetical protein [Phycisphaerae bacterium]